MPPPTLWHEASTMGVYESGHKRAAGSIVLLACLAMGLAMAPQVKATYAGVIGRLAFGLDVGDGNADIYSVKPDGNAVRRLTAMSDFEACTAYSPDGRQLAYCRGIGSSGGVIEIWRMKQNGRQQVQVTHHGGRSTFPDFSPDGARIAFQSAVPSNGTFDIYVTQIDGTGLLRMTDDPGQDQQPAWSPDGTKIAFVSTRSGVSQVWLMNADGTNLTQITFDSAPKGQRPSWSPDGTRIAFQSNGTGGGDIYVMNADGTGQARLTSDPAGESGPAWSPDGTRIAFLSLRDLPAARNVYIMNADGSDPHVVHPGGFQFVPAWQPLPDDAD